MSNVTGRERSDGPGEITEHSSVSSLAISLKLNCVMALICHRETSFGKDREETKQCEVGGM